MADATHATHPSPLPVPVQRVGKIEVPLPRYQTAHAAGMDLHAAIDAPITLGSLERRMIPTGIALAIPRGYEGQVRPRSGLAAKHGITVLNAPGTIDADFRGEIGIVLVNLSREPVTIQPLDRIAQIVFAKHETARLDVVDSLDATERGAGGYGSTGVSGGAGERAGGR
jgi:dUTP pyrophosphatase